MLVRLGRQRATTRCEGFAPRPVQNDCRDPSRWAVPKNREAHLRWGLHFQIPIPAAWQVLCAEGWGFCSRHLVHIITNSQWLVLLVAKCKDWFPVGPVKLQPEGPNPENSSALAKWGCSSPRLGRHSAHFAPKGKPKPVLGARGSSMIFFAHWPSLGPMTGDQLLGPLNMDQRTPKRKCRPIWATVLHKISTWIASCCFLSMHFTPKNQQQ